MPETLFFYQLKISRFVNRTLRGLTGLLLIFLAITANAKPFVLTEFTNGWAGHLSSSLQEQGKILSLDDVRELKRQGKFIPVQTDAFSGGLNSPPVWIHLQALNPTPLPLPFQLVIGTSWIDYLDVFVVHNNETIATWHTGDKHANAEGLQPGRGFVFDPVFRPGLNDIYIRAETPDPLNLPIKFVRANEVKKRETRTHYLAGFLYGYLVALLAYNLFLYSGLGERSHLYYSLYLGSVITVNYAYSGHGFAFAWHNYPELQQYLIPVFMMVFANCGLLFASRFLSLAEHATGALRLVKRVTIFANGIFLLSVLMKNQLAALIIAFSFVIIFTVLMVYLGILTIKQGRIAGGYFLLATICGMAGTASTVFSVLGVIPFTANRYHGLEIGIILEATLLALALTHQMRTTEASRINAENLARIDPLTGINNRRAFLELAGSVWNNAVRNKRPLSLIMLDIDHFKEVNDLHGHNAGDQILVNISKLLTEACRAGDILARWGGEEFILLLPETPIDNAYKFAQRLRESIETHHQYFRDDAIILTASFGVAERSLDQEQLEELINFTDNLLYEAKQSGHNRVSGSTN